VFFQGGDEFPEGGLQGRCFCREAAGIVFHDSKILTGC
jgi:hypothetical protein